MIVIVTFRMAYNYERSLLLRAIA